MNILPGNDISSWERINDVANVCSICLGVLTVVFASVLYYSGTKIQSLKDKRLAIIQAESNSKIAQANSVSETAKADAARANEQAARANETAVVIGKENLQLRNDFNKTTTEVDIERQKLAKTQVEVAEAKAKQADAERFLFEIQEKVRSRSLTLNQKNAFASH